MKKTLIVALIFSSSLFSKVISSDDYSFTLIELESKKIIVEQDKEKPMVLASVSKLFTLFYSLSILGPQYRFETSVYSKGKISNRVLEGDLYLVGTGAPYLTAPQLLSLIHQVKDKGIKKVKGKLFLDDSALEFTTRLSPLGLEDQADNPSMGALNIEFNRFSIWGRGKEPLPPLKNLSLEIKKEKSNGLKFKNSSTAKEEKWFVYQKEKMKFIEDIPTRDSTFFTGHYFQYLAGLHGLEVSKIEKAQRPSDSKKIATHKGLPLERLAYLGIEYSNNLIAETLLKTSVKESKRKSYPSDESAKLMHEWLKGKFSKVNWNKSQFQNGSGLTLNNQVSALNMAQYLSEIAQTSFEGRSFWSLLSINSHSGSLAKRLTSPDLAFRVYAKSGSLYYVNNLAGYLIGKSGKKYAFALFMTDEKKRESLGGDNSPEKNKLRLESKKWYQQTARFQDEIIKGWINKY